MLLARLFEKSSLAKHLISGFHRCGLCPLSRDAIPSHKLSKALLLAKSFTPEPQSTESGHSEQAEGAKTEIVIHLDGVCTINDTVTPL